MGIGLGQALVVDADAPLRAVVASHLADQGYGVSEAAEVRAALRALEDFQAVSVKQGPFLGTENDKINVEVKKK